MMLDGHVELRLQPITGPEELVREQRVVFIPQHPGSERDIEATHLGEYAPRDCHVRANQRSRALRVELVRAGQAGTKQPLVEPGPLQVRRDPDATASASSRRIGPHIPLTQSGGGRTSSSVKRNTAPHASRRPRLRAWHCPTTDSNR